MTQSSTKESTQDKELNHILNDVSYIHKNYGATRGGITLGYVVYENHLFIGIAYCNPADQFSKSLGRKTANQRIIEANDVMNNAVNNQVRPDLESINKSSKSSYHIHDAATVLTGLFKTTADVNAIVELNDVRMNIIRNFIYRYYNLSRFSVFTTK